MSVQEQEKLRKKHYSEAMRYMDNAKECLKNAKKDGKYYNDPKYVRMACGAAYNGVLIALEGYFKLKDVEMPKGRGRVRLYRLKAIELFHGA